MYRYVMYESQSFTIISLTLVLSTVSLKTMRTCSLVTCVTMHVSASSSRRSVVLMLKLASQSALRSTTVPSTVVMLATIVEMLACSSGICAVRMAATE